MRFIWDENKNRTNRVKHGLDFEDAKLVFFDRWALIQPDRFVDGEQRWQTLGSAGGVVVLAVFHTLREEDGDEVIRIISARKATIMKDKNTTRNSAPKLSKAQRQRLESLARTPDDQIDTADIPESRDWRRAVRFSRRPRTITVQLEADILEWLSSQDRNVTRILNRILRLMMDLTTRIGRRRTAA